MDIDTRGRKRGQSNESDSICIIGLGYVGLRLATAFDSTDYSVEGYDIDSERVASLRDGRDPTGEIRSRVLEEGDVTFTDDPDCIGGCEYVVVAVPTPVTDSKTPDTSMVRDAGRTVGEHLSRGATVVLESTVYPGATREVLIPALEAGSGMVAGEDFSVGYSPERVVPGEDSRDLGEIVKIISAQDAETLDDLRELYGSVVDAGLHEAPTMETAEAAKCLENTQRDLNIGLVNEFAVACRRTDVNADPEDVLAAAGTKWNFHDYRPGLVGGHCLPVDPYFLVYAFEEQGFSPSLIRTARSVNEGVAEYVAETTVEALKQRPRTVAPGTTDQRTGRAGGKAGRTDSTDRSDMTEIGADRTDGGTDSSSSSGRVLVAGLAYKPNTSDVRSSSVGAVVDRLRERGVEVVGADPRCDADTASRAFDIPVQEDLSVGGFDALVVPTPHDELRDLDLERVGAEMNDSPLLVDVKGAFDGDAAREAGFVYRRL